MEYEIVSKININKSAMTKIGNFYYDPACDGLYHESPWPFPVQLMVSERLTKCQVTPGFIKLPFILKGWINLDILIREIELMKLVENDRILMHASCVDNTLIVGFPNSGKTYQTYKSAADGGKLISEEYTILTGNKAYPYRMTTRSCFSKRTLRDCKIKTTAAEETKLAISTIRAAVMPFMFEPVIWKETPVSGESTKIEKIVYGSSGKEIKNWKIFTILCENEFPFMANEFLQAYAVASGFDIILIQEKLRNLIRDFIHAVYPDSKP